MSNRFIVILCFCVSTIAGMQGDSLFGEAKKNAHEQHYEQALTLCNMLLENDSSDVDALLLSGLINKWRGEEAAATTLLQQVIKHAPGYKDAWIALIDIKKKSMSACSTAQNACKQFPGDSLFNNMQKETCVNDHDNKKQKKISLRTGFETIAFGKSYDRKPWYSGEMEINVTTDTWRFGTALHGQQRDYGSLKVKAGEFEGRIQRKIVRNVTGVFLFTLSPYMFIDTLYPQQSVGCEAYGGLPWNMEGDVAIRCRDYKMMKTTTLVTGIGRYCKNYLLSGRIHSTITSGSSYLNGGVEVRRFTLKNDKLFTSVAFFAGRSPFDGGAVVPSGYLTTAELRCTQTVFVARNMLLQPSLGFGGEQHVRIVSDASYLKKEKIIGNIQYRMFVTIGIQIGTED